MAVSGFPKLRDRSRPAIAGLCAGAVNCVPVVPPLPLTTNQMELCAPEFDKCDRPSIQELKRIAVQIHARFVDVEAGGARPRGEREVRLFGDAAFTMYGFNRTPLL